MTKRTEQGSVSVELVLMAPVLVVLALFVVLSGRSGEALRQVQHAADQGARAASQVALTHRQSVGVSSASADLRESGFACSDEHIAVNLSRIGKLRAVTVTVSCSVNHGGLSLLKLSDRRVSADSTEVIDYYRAD